MSGLYTSHRSVLSSNATGGGLWWLQAILSLVISVSRYSLALVGCMVFHSLLAQEVGASGIDSLQGASVKNEFSDLCFRCHGHKKVKAHINLEELVQTSDFTRDFKTWEKVLQALESEEMPPEDEIQPSSELRSSLAQWIRVSLEGSVRASSGDPGPVVLRRLTAAEFTYAIEDLTGLSLDFSHFLVDEAVGGEGFSNVGEVQFIQGSGLERYLEAARQVADHAIVGAGPLSFYPDPGMSGQELSAIERIQTIYRNHGFRTGAGEGAEAFGLEQYPKAFYVCWQYQHRISLGLEALSLDDLATKEDLEPAFVRHVWSVLNEANLTYPSREIQAAWERFPVPEVHHETLQSQGIGESRELYELLFSWQSALAANAGDDEESPVLDSRAFRPRKEHLFRFRLNWARGEQQAEIQLSLTPPRAFETDRHVVVWSNPRIRFRFQERPPSSYRPLRDLLEEDQRSALQFGRAVDGGAIDSNDFSLQGPGSFTIRLPVPQEAVSADFLVTARLDTEAGSGSLLRCELSDGRVEGETVASTGSSSALLGDPDQTEQQGWNQGVADFAARFPQVSHREPAPSDRDPIPLPLDNSYNNPERNAFHVLIKYHRDDAFLTRYLVNEKTRLDLDQAWADLLSSFGYHDTWLQFLGRRYGKGIEFLKWNEFSSDSLSEWPEEARPYLVGLLDNFENMQEQLRAAQRNHLEDVLHLAGRAWRRDVTETERQRFAEYYRRLTADSKRTHSEAIRQLLTRVFVSPAFLYRVENALSGSGRQSISALELATRLSFFLWSSVPDDRLRKVAEDGTLLGDEGLLKETRRMLQDRKAERLAWEFFGQWFGIQRFAEYSGIDPTRFPEFSDTVKHSLEQEARLFFSDIVSRDRPVREVLFSNKIFVNRTLADHYSVPISLIENFDKEEWVQVDRAREFHRGGLLSLGAVHAVTSAPLRTSAVKRGDWILRRVLGTPVPPPPPDAGSISPDETASDSETIRQRLERHRQDPACYNCHARMDPLGFALDNFDPIGRWRNLYSDGNPINTQSELEDGTGIEDLEGLHGYLASKVHLFHKTFFTKLLGYALGRSEAVSDRPLIEGMVDSMREDERFSRLVEAIVLSPQFRSKRAWAEGDETVGVEKREIE